MSPSVPSATEAKGGSGAAQRKMRSAGDPDASQKMADDGGSSAGVRARRRGANGQGKDRAGMRRPVVSQDPPIGAEGRRSAVRDERNKARA